MSAPAVTSLALANVNNVFIGTRGGTLTFSGVTVTSRDVGGPIDDYRPFVMASGPSTMSASDTTFRELGWDWNASYGVSWSHGATGVVERSVFEESYIGAYTNAAVDLEFRDSIFRNNTVYGLDPHTYSKRLVVDGAQAYGNGSHGIIFSDHVTASVVRNSVSHDNGENGIIMDERSTDNLIENNLVYDNKGDGFVTADSPRLTVESNTIRGNRVGVRLDPGDAATVTLHDNLITENTLAFQHADLSSTNTVTENGGQWNTQRLRWIWAVYAAIVVVFGAVSAVSVLREERRTARYRLAA